MADSKNPFLDGNELIRPNAKFSVENSERLGLYVLLYNEILGSLKDYQGNRLDLDVLVNKRIEDVMKIAKKIYQNRSIGMDDNHGIDVSDPNYGFAQDWIKMYLPVKSEVQKDANGNPIKIGSRTLYDEKSSADCANYVDAFLKNYEAVKAEEKYIASMMGKDVLSLKDGDLYLAAKRQKVSELYEYYRSNSDYKPGKFDKEGNSKSGIFAREYYDGLNKLQKMKREHRRHNGKLLLKSLATAGFAALGIVSAGALLSYGGFALTALFGTAFSAAGVGAAALGAVGSVIGFYGTKNMFKRAREDFRKSLKNRRERLDFVGEKFHGKDLERFLGAIKDKDGKNLTLTEKEVMFKFSKAARLYFEKGGMEGVPQELKMYLPESIIKEYKLDVEKDRWQFVNNKKGAFANLMQSYTHVVDSLAKTDDEGKPSKRENLGEARTLVNNAGSRDDVFIANQYLEDYGTNIAPEHLSVMRRTLADKAFQSIKNDLFEGEYHKTTVGDADDLMKDDRFTGILSKSNTPNVKSKVADAIKFLNTEAIGFGNDRPLNTALGVSARSQIMFEDESAVRSAVDTLSSRGTSPDPAKVATVVNKLKGNSSTKQAFDITTVQNAINDIKAENEDVANYLQSMVDNKVATLINDEASIVSAIGGGLTVDDEIVKAIYNISRQKKGEFSSKYEHGGTTVTASFDEIKTKILSSSSLNDTQKENAVQMLYSQLDAIDMRERTSARQHVFNSIQSGSVTGFDDLMTKIEGITLENLSTQADLLDNVIPSSSLGDYYAVQARTKIEKLFETKVNEVKTNRTGTSTDRLGRIVECLSTINSSDRLDVLQKQRLTKKLEDAIQTAVKDVLGDDKEFFAEKYDSSKYGILLDKPYSQKGLLEYFNMKTAESEALREDLNYRRTLSTVYQMITTGNLGYKVKETESEGKAFSVIFLDKKRSDNDPLISVLRDMETASKNAVIDNFAVDDTRDNSGNVTARAKDITYNSTYMRDMMTCLTNIQALDPNDQYAALIVMKKRCLSMYKAHLNNFIDKNRGSATIDTYINTAGTMDDIKDKVYDAWCSQDPAQPGILAMIDAELENLKNSNLEIIKKYGYYGALESAVAATDRRKVGSYAVERESMM